MAGLNYNYDGVFFYTFDHRFPISEVSDISAPDRRLVQAMKSIENCQVLGYRVNLLKGSSEDVAYSSTMSQFGVDDRTTTILTAKKFSFLRKLEKYLLTAERRKEIETYYKNYVNGPHFLDPRTVKQDREDYFKKLFDLAQVKAKFILSLIP